MDKNYKASVVIDEVLSKSVNSLDGEGGIAADIQQQIGVALATSRTRPPSVNLAYDDLSFLVRHIDSLWLTAQRLVQESSSLNVAGAHEQDLEDLMMELRDLAALRVRLMAALRALEYQIHSGACKSATQRFGVDATQQRYVNWPFATPRPFSRVA